jgi:hypothetical protein
MNGEDEMTVMPTEVCDETEAVAIYEIARTAEGWTIFHAGQTIGARDSKVAAWDAAMAVAYPSMLSGSGVVIKVASNATERHVPRNW